MVKIVHSRSDFVRLVLEGSPEEIQAFMGALPNALPPNARLDACEKVDERTLAGPEAINAFTIDENVEGEASEETIPADLALCDDCRREVLDGTNRRYGYPFTTCAQCGPRFTVIQDMPYERLRTTLSVFELCPDCRREYEEPGNRRFHAESIACPKCGPQLVLEDADGRRVDGSPLTQARAALARGEIVAVRGLGGFLLATDACNREALRRLRQRKNRPHKSFAVMARTIGLVRQFCLCDPVEEQLLISAEAPIVILDPHPAATHSPVLPIDLLSPDTETLGILLPTTSLQVLLAEPLAGDPIPPFDWLVMTSGNPGGEPVCISNSEARERLQGIADFFLFHDREINLRNEDSLCILQGGQPQLWRRARSYAPNPIRVAVPANRCVLAMGAELKNTIAMAYADQVVLSPHIGDLEANAAVVGLRQLVETLPRFVNRAPEVVAVDLHPDLHCTRMGREIAARWGLPTVEVQHHYAHAVAGLAEQGCETGLGLVFDDAGLGTDGHIWGAELLAVAPDRFQRLASFTGVPLPGGDDAIRRPARQLIGRCCSAGLKLPDVLRAQTGISEEEGRIWTRLCESQVNAPITHAAGRLLDSFSALLGLAPHTTSYEGQSLIRLEAAARRHLPGRETPVMCFRSEERGGMLWLDWSEAFAQLFEHPNRLAGEADAWAYAAHVAIADAATRMAVYGAARTGLRDIILSGGVFMNRMLTSFVMSRLESLDLTVRLHHATPPNDGCVALGQALVAGALAESAARPESFGWPHPENH